MDCCINNNLNKNISFKSIVKIGNFKINSRAGEFFQTHQKEISKLALTGNASPKKIIQLSKKTKYYNDVKKFYEIIDSTNIDKQLLKVKPNSRKHLKILEQLFSQKANVILDVNSNKKIDKIISDKTPCVFIANHSNIFEENLCSAFLSILYKKYLQTKGNELPLTNILRGGYEITTLKPDSERAADLLKGCVYICGDVFSNESRRQNIPILKQVLDNINKNNLFLFPEGINRFKNTSIREQIMPGIEKIMKLLWKKDNNIVLIPVGFAENIEKSKNQNALFGAINIGHPITSKQQNNVNLLTIIADKMQLCYSKAKNKADKL